MDMPDELDQNTSQTMQLQDLPDHVLTRIFVHLDYRERIHLESVSRTWRALALDYAWRDQHILRFSREMLRLDEPWNDKKRINSIIDDLNRRQSEVKTNLVRDYTEFNKYESSGKKVRKYEKNLEVAQFRAMDEYWEIFTDPALYKQEKPSIQLAPLKAVIHRCAPFLDELHLHNHFDIQMRFGRIFHQLTNPFGRLAHLHINVHLDSWHLRKIQCHLAPQLVSLAAVPINNDKSMVAFKELLANCNKLENLHIAEINFGKLFAGHPENNGESSQPSSSLPLAQIESKCSFMPSTLKFLFIWDNARGKDDENPDDLVNILLSLLAKCPQLCFMPICINTEYDLFELIGERNPRESEKLIRLQFPFFITKFRSFPNIQRPEFRNLKAIKVKYCSAELILHMAECCPNLEHLGVSLLYMAIRHGQNYVVDIPDLVALHQFRQLSSLDISMGFLGFADIHKLVCPGGERADIAFLDILTKLDRIHPLRSLDFKSAEKFYPAYEKNPNLSQPYLLQIARQLKHLETFSCGFYVENLDIDDRTGIEQFCEQLEQIFDSQKGANKKSFKFALLANEYEWDNYASREKKNLFVEWKKGRGTEKSQMNWHLAPSAWREREHAWHRHFELSRSIVLDELITSQFGQRTSSMLFDSFGMMEEEEH